MPQRRSHAAFTLVELLVVIGIVAMLISILLPALARARESAYRITCQSNMRQIGSALIIYMNQSKGLLPVAPMSGSARNDYAAWYFLGTSGARQDYFNNLRNSPIGRILNLYDGNYKVLVCPTDALAARRACPAYMYSYTINRMFNGSSAPPVGISRMTDCRSPADKVWLYEENDAERDDGNGELWTTTWGSCDLPSIRHDSRGINLPDAPTPLGVPNGKRRGNVLFADGHADFVPRTVSMSKSHCVPKPERVSGEEILIAPPPLN